MLELESTYRIEIRTKRLLSLSDFRCKYHAVMQLTVRRKERCRERGCRRKEGVTREVERIVHLAATEAKGAKRDWARNTDQVTATE